MPALANPQHEVFAIARARGALLEDAYGEAGYAARKGHAWRIANRPEVQARIAELRAERSRVEEAFPRTIINVLMHLAQVNDERDTPAGSRETRASLLEALRLERQIADAKRRDQDNLMKTVSYGFRRPPGDRPPTAIEPPTDRPLTALPAPADRPATAVPAC
jgi:hypothetical protein